MTQQLTKITTDIQALDLNVIHQMHVHNSAIALNDSSKDLYTMIGGQYNQFLDDNNLSVSPLSVKQFLLSKEWKASTFNSKLNALRKIIANQSQVAGNFLLIAGIKEAINQTIKRVKLNEAITKDDYLTEQQINNVISYCDERHGFIIEFLFKTGCRISEMINTKLDDIHENGKITKIDVIGKGNKQRHVFIDSYLLNYIKNCYLSQSYLFENTLHKQLNRSNVYKKVHQFGSMAGFNIGNHTLRHSCAMHLKEAGKSPQYIQKYLGHKDVATTLKYYFHEKPDEEVIECFL